MKHNVVMVLAGLAALVDGIANHVTNKPVNHMGILLFLVMLIYFFDKATEHYKNKLDGYKKAIGSEL